MLNRILAALGLARRVTVKVAPNAPMNKAHTAGINAFHAGALLSSNPHPTGAERTAWEDGWTDASFGFGPIAA